MFLKNHFLCFHLDLFPPNLGKISDEHGKRFHQEIKAMENRFQGKITKNMLADNYWFYSEKVTPCISEKIKALLNANSTTINYCVLAE